MTGRTIYCGAVLAGIIYDAGDAQGRHPNECIDVRTFGINGLTSEWILAMSESKLWYLIQLTSLVAQTSN